MGIFNHFPYTNFHEINLDWVIYEVKRIVKDNIKLTDDFKELSDYIKNYLTNNLDEALQELLNELIESGQLDQMIMDAINSLEARVDEIEIPEFKYNLSYIKTNDRTDLRPVLCTYNPARRSITYVAQASEDTYMKIGDLADDYITIANEQTTVLLHHPNDICYYNGKILIADLTNNIKVLDAQSLSPEEDIIVSWGAQEVIGIAYNDETDKLYIEGSVHGDTTNVAYAELKIDGSVENQFLIPIEKYHGESYQDGYIQSLAMIDGQLFTLASSLTPTGVSGGFTLIAIDTLNKKIKYTKYFNILGEAESIVQLDGELLVYGFAQYPIGAVSKAAMCAVMSIIPRCNIIQDIYVDETQALCGDGSQTNPFNSFSCAVYNAQSFSSSQCIIYLLSNITKTFNISNFRENQIVIQGGNHNIEIENRNFYNVNFIFYDTEFVRTSSGNYIWSFDRDSKLTMINCTLSRTVGDLPLIRVNSAYAVFNNVNVNNLGDSFGVIQTRKGALVNFEIGTINMPAGAGKIINTVEGVVINAKAIPEEYTAPWSGAGIVLGKNSRNIT